MLALIIADNPFATREHALLSRLEVGLADEGVRVVHASPAAVTRPPNSPALGIQSTVVSYVSPGLALPPLVRRAAAGLIESIERSTEEAAKIDIVHAFGEACWPVAQEVARATNATLLIELWHPGMVSHAAQVLGRARRRGSEHLPEFVTSQAAVASALAAVEPRARIYSAPWGVHVPQAVRPVRADLAAQDLSFGVLYDTGEHRSLAPPLAGIAEATRGFADSVIVAAIEEATSRREARLWATGRKLKLLDRLSILPDMEARREPVLGMDFLLVPEAHGRQRTIVLEAMARGMAVVSPRDLAIDVLDDPHIVQLVSDNSPGGWSRAIRSLLMSPAALTDLTRAAHQHVRTHRSASGHIASVLRAYQQAVEAPAVATA